MSAYVSCHSVSQIHTVAVVSCSLENVQKRAFLIIYGELFANRTCSYHEFCREAGSLSLADRREGLSFKFFKKMIRPDSCIHHLIPGKRDESILSRLRNPSQYSIPLARTERFKRSSVPALDSWRPPPNTTVRPRV